jgi:hypothetical protein
MITRRRFLQLLGWLAAPIAIGGIGWRDKVAWAFDRAAARGLALVQSPEHRLRAHFSYLNLDPVGVEQFFEDYQRYRKLSRHVPLSSEVCTRYLMSTDFFRHGADESRLVRYVGFYDPDNTPCLNPLAEFDDEA